jgi:DNA polymerase-3 subunit delta'
MARAEVSEEAAHGLLRMARGAPGRAWRLSAARALELDEAARRLVQQLPRIDPSQAQHLADGFRGAEGAERFALVLDRLAAAVRDQATRAVEEGGEAAQLAEAWSALADLPGEVEGLNLDRADAFFSALRLLKAAV